jgi:hypothetical protein
MREEQGVDLNEVDDDFVSDTDENTLESSFGPGELS